MDVMQSPRCWGLDEHPVFEFAGPSVVRLRKSRQADEGVLSSSIQSLLATGAQCSM